MLELIPPFVTAIVLMLGSVAIFAIIYYGLLFAFKSIPEKERLNFSAVLPYYGALVLIIYLFYFFTFIGDFENPPVKGVIIATYVVALFFVSMPRFLYFLGLKEEAVTFNLLLATTFFIGIAKYYTTVPEIRTDISLFLSNNLTPNYFDYIVLLFLGIIVGLIIEYLVGPLLSKLKKKETP